MLENVLYDRKNMLYEDLLEHVTSHQMLVTCCIDAHFTAAQVLPNRALIYYDPLNSRLAYVGGEGFKKFLSYLLLKCGYGDNQHIAENEDHYTGSSTNATRRMIYSVWRDIHKISGPDRLVRMIELPLNLDHWLLINDRHEPAPHVDAADGQHVLLPDLPLRGPLQGLRAIARARPELDRAA